MYMEIKPFGSVGFGIYLRLNIRSKKGHEMTHTPGPWKVVTCIGGELCIHDTIDGLHIAEPHGGLIEQEANAHLLAASPGLLEACERAEQALRNLANGFLKGDAKTIAENEAANLRADIAKARGETP